MITIQGQFICCLWDPWPDVQGSPCLLPPLLPLGWSGELSGGLGGEGTDGQVLSLVLDACCPACWLLRDVVPSVLRPSWQWEGSGGRKVERGRGACGLHWVATLRASLLRAPQPLRAGPPSSPVREQLQAFPAGVSPVSQPGRQALGDLIGAPPPHSSESLNSGTFQPNEI